MRRNAPLFGLAMVVAGGAWMSGPPRDWLGAGTQGPTRRSICPAVDLTPVASPRKCGRSCGRDRWPVKTLSDPDRQRVNAEPVVTTVESLAALPRPPYRPQYERVSPTETTIFCIEGMIYDPPQPQQDGDIHIVVAGLVDTNMTMVTEIPDPRCYRACSSGFAQLYAQARAVLEDRLQYWDTDTLRIRIIGVGFFDRDHGQWGAAPNFIELHPVLAIEFP